MNGFVLYMDPGVDQVDVALRPRNYRQGSGADVRGRRGSLSLTFLRGGACREHTWPCVHIASPARGHLVAIWVSRGGDNWPCKCLELNVTDGPEWSFEGFSADRKSTRLNSSH